MSLLFRYLFYALLDIFGALDIVWCKNSCFCLVYSLHSVSALVCFVHDRFLVLVCMLQFCFSTEDIWPLNLVDIYKRL